MKRTHSLFLTGILVLLALMLVLPSLAQSGVIGTVNIGGGINILSGPGKNYAVRAGVPNLTRLEVVGRNADGTWVEVVTPNRRRTAWIPVGAISLPVDVLSLPQTSGLNAWSAYVKTPVLNIRKGPGANFDVLGQLVYGRGLNITGRNVEGSWARVEVPGETSGWASIRYLSINFDFSAAPVVDLTGVFEGFVDPIPVGNEVVGFITAVPAAIVRFGPGSEYAFLIALETGQGVYLRGRNTPNTWLLVQLDNGDTGWIRRDLISTTHPTETLEIIGNS